jgi:acetyl esterase/lipase
MKPALRVALLLSSLLSACSPINLLNATVPTAGLTIAKDIPYGEGPRRKLDIYRADASVGTLPVAVFIYGGSWQSGSKNDYLFVAGELARRGILVAVPDYRVYPEVRYPGFVEDGAAAVAYVRRVAPSWGGDPHRLFVVGHSAGAYIAAMLALDPKFLAAAGDSRDHLAGFVGLSGPYDFLPIREADIREVFGAFADSPAAMVITYADGHNPPTLLLHGEADDTVYLRNTTALASRIRAAGGPVEVKTYPGVGHIGIVLGFAPLFRSRSPALDDAATFIAQTPARPYPAE